MSLKVRAVPGGELVLACLTQGRCNVTLSVVSPHLADVEVLDEHNRVSTPKLLGGDETTWRYNGARGNLSTLFNARTFKND